MATFVGKRGVISKAAAAPKQASQEPKPEAGKTRAELVEEAEALGIEVSPRASKARIAKLIEDAPVM